MAIRHSIKPFPKHIDRESFAHWISGFTDGEGCFQIYKDKGHFRSGFVIGLRADDRPVLELIMSFWQCGRIYYCKKSDQPSGRGSPQFIYQVNDLESIRTVVVRHFDRYPLHAKKKNDFVIWKKAVELHFQIYCRRIVFRRDSEGRSTGQLPKWLPDDIDKMQKLYAALRDQRAFKP